MQTLSTAGEYVEFTWDHHNRLTTAEFYADDTKATLEKTVVVTEKSIRE